MTLRVAIVGGGPTSLYTFARLAASRKPMRIEVFEREPSIGPGMPYREGINHPDMLSNIASREIPPVVDTLAGWLRGLDAQSLRGYGLTPETVADDAYYPRLLLGAFYTAQANEVVARARLAGHSVALRTRTRVTDIEPVAEGIRIDWRHAAGPGSALFDHVVIATGHDWPDEARADGVTFVSPWPSEKLRRLAGSRIGILGSMLSAIDVAVAIASARGSFLGDGETLVWEPGAGGDFTLTMMSKNGLLPEADVYYPVPSEPLPTLTPERIEAEAAHGTDGLLDRAFALFSADLAALDADYARRIGLDRLTLETFAAAHFAERMASDPFDWARRNLDEARRDRPRRHVVPWRYAILRAHEVFETVVPLLSEADLARFGLHLRTVFTDNYASVPHRSIERLLALRDAGRLEVRAVGDEPSFHATPNGVRVAHEGNEIEVDVIVDARGQQAKTIAELGFPGLARSGVVGPMRQPDSYALPLLVPTAGTIQCLALPVLLRRRPFVQGLVNAHEMGVEAAEAILATARSGEADAA